MMNNTAMTMNATFTPATMDTFPRPVGEKAPASAMYFGANLDYDTGKKRTREKKKAVKERQKRYYLKELQEKIDTKDELVVPYAEMNFRMKFISKEELEAIKERFNK